MGKDPRPRVPIRPIVALTCWGLYADLAFLVIQATIMFLAIGQWAVGLAYGAMGAAMVTFLATTGWDRAQAAILTLRRFDDRG